MSPGTQQKPMLKSIPQKLKKYSKMIPEMDPQDALKHKKNVYNLFQNIANKRLQNKHQENMTFSGLRQRTWCVAT